MANCCIQCGLLDGQHEPDCDYRKTEILLEEELISAQHELEKAASSDFEVAKNYCEAYLDAYWALHQSRNSGEKGRHGTKK